MQLFVLDYSGVCCERKNIETLHIKHEMEYNKITEAKIASKI